MYIQKSLSSKVDSKGYSQVLLFVQNGRKGKFRMKTNIFAPIEYWNAKKNEINIPRKIGSDKNDELLAIRSSLKKMIMQIESLIQIYQSEATKELIETTLPLVANMSGAITREKVDEALTNNSKDNRHENEQVAEETIFDIAEVYLKKGFSDGRIRSNRVCFRCMIRYEYYRNSILKKPFKWDLLTTSKRDIEDFFEYIANEYKLQEKYPEQFALVEYNEPNKPRKQTKEMQQRGGNRLYCMKKQVKSFWNWMLKTERTTNNPFSGVDLGSENYGTPYYITIEERTLIADHDFSGNKHLERQRDIFVFQCLVGCRVGDLTSFTPDNIVNGILTYMPHKTKDEGSAFVARVPLNQQALDLLKKYEGVDKRGRIFPFIADNNYNDAIKDILTECEIKRMVSVRNPLTEEMEMKPINEIASSHMARRTFVGNAYKKVKDPNLIGRMSGHVEGSKAFNRYRDIDNDMLKEVIDLIS